MTRTHPLQVVRLLGLIMLGSLLVHATTAPPRTYRLQYRIANNSNPLVSSSSPSAAVVEDEEQQQQWTTKATVLLTEHSVKLDDIRSTWSYSDVQGLRAGAPYALRLVAASDEGHVLAQTQISPCALLTAKQYANTPIRGTLERVGLVMGGPQRMTPVGIRHLAPYVDNVCALSVFASSLKAVEEHAKQNNKRQQLPAPDTPTSLAMKFTVQRAPVLPTPADEPLGVNTLGAASTNTKRKAKANTDNNNNKADAEQQQQEEPDTRSFIEKYWVYIAMFMGYSVLSALLNPAGKAQQGGGGAAKQK